MWQASTSQGFFWLASYPKSGNTWLRMALQSLERGGAMVQFGERDTWYPMASTREAFENVLYIESSDLTIEEVESLRPELYRTMAAEAKAPLIRKVHDAWTRTASGQPLFPPETTLGAIYIVRDPRDVAISFSYHASCSIDAAIEFLGNPDAVFDAPERSLRQQTRQILSTWSAHVTSWMDAPGISVLPVRYEDMSVDPAAVLTDVTRLLGWQPESDLISAAVAHTRFDVLKETEERVGFREKPRTMKRFFRQGKAQSWHGVLSAGQAARLERDHGEVMTRLGYL